jgi:hypothetical protein
MLPGGISIDADIVYHSRGRLVSREIVGGGAVRHRRQDQVKKVVFVGCPTRGRSRNPTHDEQSTA